MTKQAGSENDESELDGWRAGSRRLFMCAGYQCKAVRARTVTFPHIVQLDRDKPSARQPGCLKKDTHVFHYTALLFDGAWPSGRLLVANWEQVELGAKNLGESGPGRTSRRVAHCSPSLQPPASTPVARSSQLVLGLESLGSPHPSFCC